MSKNSQELYSLYVLTALEEKKKELQKEINNSIIPSRKKKEQLLKEKLTYFGSFIDVI